MTTKTQTVPKVSVVMAVYNGEKYLREAVESILNQTYRDFEFVIVNDGSKDSSLDIIKSYNDPRIRLVINEKNMGLIFSLNRGLSEAKTDLIARMDADDISVPERLEKQYDFMKQNPDITVVGTAIEVINQDGKFVYLQPALEKDEAIKRGLSAGCMFSHPTTMFRKKPVLSVGGYRKESKAAEDYDLWVRLADDYKFANINFPYLKYRKHGNNKSLGEKSIRSDTNACSDNQWQKYLPDGPAPVGKWPIIWPKKTKKLFRNSQNKYYSALHLLFAYQYKRRGNSKLSVQHARAAIS